MQFFGWFRRKPSEKREAPTSTPRRWTWLSGKRILLNTPYIIPKDVAEGNRLDLQHHLLKVVAGGNYRAPLRQPQAILDVACGTGIWGREMALEFPRARVYGFDFDRTSMDAALARLGPTGRLPANFQFLEADALQRFPFEEGSFDFTHARFIAGFVPADRWLAVVAEMVRVTKAGGCIELVEPVSNPQSPSQAFTTLMDTVAQLGQARNLEQRPGDRLMEYLQQAGVQRVQQRRFVIGMGRDAQRQRRLFAADMLAFVKQMEPVLVRTGLLTQERYTALLKEAESEVPRLGITLPIVFAFGRKPLAGG
jgi:ubiquinone/menaquinone biosynthesis C-methylase UbiE